MDIESKRRRGGKPKYSDALKRQVALAYLGGTARIGEIAERFNLSKVSSVRTFVKWYRLQGAEPVAAVEGVFPGDSGDLLRENAELRAQLEHERMRNLGLETMIDIAEGELEVDIRKKSVSKQSRP
jgi:transposase